MYRGLPESRIKYTEKMDGLGLKVGVRGGRVEKKKEKTEMMCDKDVLGLYSVEF